MVLSGVVPHNFHRPLPAGSIRVADADDPPTVGRVLDAHATCHVITSPTGSTVILHVTWGVSGCDDAACGNAGERDPGPVMRGPGVR